jgi:GntR family transcriptional regulator/MocR family aminotransferase
MARTLSVSRMTVTVAYERLASEGFTTSRARAGTFVSDGVLGARGRTAEDRAGGKLKPRRVWQSIDLPKPFANLPEFYFRTGITDSSLFPHHAWRRIVNRTLRAHGRTIGVYGDHAGHPELRRAIARHVGVSRGVRASADDVTVTNGMQQALDILARVLVAPGDRVAMEDPGYPPVRRLFTSLDLDVCGVHVDEEGLVVSAIPRGVRLVYVTPSHQYPLGVSMTLRRRQALLSWARRHRAAIVEDDYDSEFRFGGRPLDALQTLDTEGRVIYVGSFSKTLLPGFRLGFLVAPSSLHSAVRKAKAVADWHTSTLEQLALTRFIDDGSLAGHIRKLSSAYRQRHDLILDILNKDFAEHLEPIPSATGLHVAALARKAPVERIAAIANRALAMDVAIEVLSHFAVTNAPRSGVVLGYGGVPTTRIEEGLRRLRKCFAAR